MSKEQLIINRVGILSFWTWLKFGVSSFKEAPFKLMLIVLFYLVIFASLFFISTIYPGEYIYSLVVTFVLSLMFPLGLASISYAYILLKKYGQFRIGQVFSQLIRGPAPRLIIIYVLLMLLFSIIGNYLIFILPVYQTVISYLLEAIFVVLQMLILIAIPMNLLIDDSLKPFKTLYISFQALICNFLPCVFFITSVFLTLIIFILLAKFASLVIGNFAILLYLIELWVFIIWLCLASIGMVKNIFVEITYSS